MSPQTHGFTVEHTGSPDRLPVVRDDADGTPWTCTPHGWTTLTGWPASEEGSRLLDAALAAARRPRSTWHTRLVRREMYQRADYYAWAARKGFPDGGNDPLTGRPYSSHLSRVLGRAENAAAARACYALARAYPSPLPR